MAENGSSTTGLEKATAALRELGQAWRGDWNDFDGRTLRDQLDDWIERVLVADDVDEAIADWRRGCGLCPRGHGHWSYYCADFDPKEPDFYTATAAVPVPPAPARRKPRTTRPEQRCSCICHDGICTRCGGSGQEPVR